MSLTLAIGGPTPPLLCRKVHSVHSGTQFLGHNLERIRNYCDSLVITVITVVEPN